MAIVGGAAMTPLMGYISEKFHSIAWAYTLPLFSYIVIALYSFFTYSFWILNSSSLPIVLASNGVILVTMISWWFDRPAVSRHSRLFRERVQLA